MDKESIAYLRENYGKKPEIELAKDLKCEYFEVAQVLRREGFLRDINMYDVNYILNNKNIKSINELGMDLGLTKNQLSNIVSRFDKTRRAKSVSDYNEKEIISKFKFIIEEKIGKPVNDTLAYEINEKEVKAYEGGYALLKWASIEKEKHMIYKYFSSLAYLFHISYPNMFRPYQFNHTKDTKNYFTSKKYLGELLYIIENKLMISKENISEIYKVNGFLNNQQLNFYGLKKFHLKFFNSKEKMIDALLEHINQAKTTKKQPTYKLKEMLENAGVSTDKCFCEECYNKDIEIHHIYPKKFASIVNFDIDSVYNLIPLCKKHHNMVKNMDIENLDLRDKNKWRSSVTEYLNDFNNN